MITFFFVKCKKCDDDLRMSRLIDLTNCFVLCPNCKNSSKLYSKTFCLQQLLLSNDDLLPLKYLYANNKTKYYLDDDIENIIKIKFDKIQENKKKKLIRKKKVELQQLERKKELIKCFADYKLECRSFGDCFTYIKYGYPDIKTVIQNEINKSIELSHRKEILYNELQKFDLPYIEARNSICYDYVNGISNKSLQDTINDAKIENFFMIHTEYLELQKIYPDDIAKEKALSNYINKTDEFNRHEIADKLFNKLFNKAFTVSID